jgi:opacity protein-like surface antigen
VTEKLSTTAAVDFSLYDTDNGNFQTFQAGAGARYQFTPWLASNLIYAYRWTDSSNSAAQSGLFQAGIVRANSVYLNLTAYFDLWPNVGLNRTIAPLTPLITTPFPQATSAIRP